MLDCLELELQQFDQRGIRSTSLQVGLADGFPVDVSIQHHVGDHFHDPLPDGHAYVKMFKRLTLEFFSGDPT